MLAHVVLNHVPVENYCFRNKCVYITHIVRRVLKTVLDRTLLDDKVSEMRTEGEGERERKGEREKERESHTQRERERERQRERERETERYIARREKENVREIV